MTTQDHFSGCARQYAAFRPRYPQTLYRWLAAIAPTRRLVWDCACGNGQASVDLVEHFQEVIGTDLSVEQLAHAAPHDRITYRAAVAEASGLPSAEFDVVTVAQALHWFDLDRFYAEVRRVLRPDGVLAVWCYGACEITEARGNAHLRHFYEQVIGPYWQPERRLVETGYRTMRFPTPELKAPDFAMVLDWSLSDLLGYMGSWSATARYIKERGTDPMPELHAAMVSHWGDPQERRPVRMPLSVRAARPNRAWTPSSVGHCGLSGQPPWARGLHD